MWVPWRGYNPGMTVANASIPVPLREDADGTIRVGGTRVTLDVVIHAHQDGATPEQIVEMFDVLKVGDVYAVVSFYLAHRVEMDEYLEKREKAGERIRREIEADPRHQALRARLSAIKSQREAS